MPVIKKLTQHKVLLDTHVFVWLMEGKSVFSFSFKKFINLAKKKENIYISSISIWEIGMLVERNRIKIEKDCLDWVEECIERSFVKLSYITPKIAIQSSRLPNYVIGDPADRILISTAHEINATLVTFDKKLLNYGKGKYISVYSPKKT